MYTETIVSHNYIEFPITNLLKPLCDSPRFGENIWGYLGRATLALAGSLQWLESTYCLESAFYDSSPHNECDLLWFSAQCNDHICAKAHSRWTNKPKKALGGFDELGSSLLTELPYLCGNKTWHIWQMVAWPMVICSMQEIPTFSWWVASGLQSKHSIGPISWDSLYKQSFTKAGGRCRCGSDLELTDQWMFSYWPWIESLWLRHHGHCVMEVNLM